MQRLLKYPPVENISAIIDLAWNYKEEINLYYLNKEESAKEENSLENRKAKEAEQFQTVLFNSILKNKHPKSTRDEEEKSNTKTNNFNEMTDRPTAFTIQEKTPDIKQTIQSEPEISSKGKVF